MADKIQKALNYLFDKHDALWATGYGEPGYSDPEKGIILANWNNVPSGLADWLEKCGYKLEWSDEWMIDYNHSKAYRTSPDCYSWESQVALTNDGEYLTPDDSASEWIEEFAMTDQGHPVRCLPSWITPDNLKEEGFEQHGELLESGFHPGQTDDPKVVAKTAFEQGAEAVVFRKVENSQFYIRFECWVRMGEV